MYTSTVVLYVVVLLQYMVGRVAREEGGPEEGMRIAQVLAVVVTPTTVPRTVQSTRPMGVGRGKDGEDDY